MDTRDFYKLSTLTILIEGRCID